MRVKRLTVIITAFLVYCILVGSTPIKARSQNDIVGNQPVPSYLKGYEQLYKKNPHTAGLEWFKDAKFGLFVHYALASLLDGGKWEYVKLIEKNGADKVNWKLFQEFKAEKFNADRIYDLALVANMRYITFTTSHLGRLRMYKTKVTNFTSLNSPAKRDLVAELSQACQKTGLGLFLYVPPETAQTDDERIHQNYTTLRELLIQYGPIAGIWFDGIGDFYKNPENYERLSETYKLVRSLQPQCLISFKEGAIGEEDFITPEHFLLPAPITWDTKKRQDRWQIRLERWERQSRQGWERFFKHKPAEINTVMQECYNRDGIGQAGGWINDESARHLTADEVMYLLEKAWSLEANLLLNIGPRGDGSIHPQDEEILKEVGRRLSNYGFPAGD
ncbi:MAG: alpha-L-fucosidase [Desulfobacterales bacterium]|nr:alpha-L-fucosidase [Desulfobacterales bacterium]